MTHTPNRVRQAARVDLGPRLIGQCLNRFKQVAHAGTVLKRAESDISDYVESENSGRSLARGCIGTFWDDVNKKTVILNLGVVICHFPIVYRAAPSQLTPVDLSRVEDAAQSAIPVQKGEHCPQRSEDSAQLLGWPEIDNFGSGSYVIPGQVAMGYRLDQKIGGQTPMGWNNVD
jgi:hypothetical protein